MHGKAFELETRQRGAETLHKLLRSEAIRSYTSTTIQEESLMAANMKSVKLRIKSVESTMQITKAMELVKIS